MTTKQALIYSIIYIGLILLGAFIAFKVWWNDTGLYGVVAFSLVGLGSLLLSSSLTRIVVPIKTDFGFMTLSSKKNYDALKQKIGPTKIRLISTLYAILFFGLFGTTAYFLIKSLDKYRNYQLENYGKLQKIKINEIHPLGKGTDLAFFDYNYNNITYGGRLDPRNYRIGDSATIIFSTQDPHIVDWENHNRNND